MKNFVGSCPKNYSYKKGNDEEDKSKKNQKICNQTKIKSND